jgi:hypothetical protein
MIYPYLKLKRKQAELAIKFQERKNKDSYRTRGVKLLQEDID